MENEDLSIVFMQIHNGRQKESDALYTEWEFHYHRCIKQGNQIHLGKSRLTPMMARQHCPFNGIRLLLVEAGRY